jgi:hypothetical protein
MKIDQQKLASGEIETKKPTKAGDAPWWVFVLINIGDVIKPESEMISAE